MPIKDGAESVVPFKQADRAATVAAIRDGLADVASGRTKPARAALRDLAKRYGMTIAEQ